MTNQQTIRPATAQDVEQIAQIADKTLFPGEYVAPMIAPFLGGADGALWLVAVQGGTIHGFAFATAEEMTEQTWNLKAIAIAPEHHRTGQGRDLLHGVELALKAQGARVLVIDTASGDDQAAARAFYPALGYDLAGTIPEFWEPGVDKVTFYKAL